MTAREEFGVSQTYNLPSTATLDLHQHHSLFVFRGKAFVQNLRKVGKTVLKMSSKNRKLLDWRYQGEHTMEKIAENIGSTIGAVKVKLHRLRRQLLGCIQNRMQEDGR